ncbi:alpha/beta hydrolase [Pedobacter sp. KR3-3]|uniref:Alpha/beta hydrolase n=1 Tax=Pedobacter albus TaxID=3113905 RepID=A0ABU7I328_9SPHI|nr:alpha/beta hydrolase [Pedobacter sp. KR3-3]MEE1943776.1 alpha/beta hydrolase [Pedobacter sp. KR3-3]
MKKTKNLILFVSMLFLLVSCKKSSPTKKTDEQTLTQASVNLGTHQLAAYTLIRQSKYLVVFESGLGDGHDVWNQKNVISSIAATSDVLSYDRAGYGKSTLGPKPRNISTLSAELAKLIEQFANHSKVILVGHSLGGMVIRDYAIKNPDKVAALLFIDPSHEYYNRPSTTDQEQIYNEFKNAYGANFGGALEASCLIEDSNYTATLPNLPHVPVTVISSTKTDALHSTADRKKWFDAHELLKAGVNDFTHIATANAGHYIMVDEPNLVVDSFKALLKKLP